jgi:transposase-like protein
MANDSRMTLLELLRKSRGEDSLEFLREGVQVLSEAVMELEVAQHVGAEQHERTIERTGQRNGYRERQWDTRVGTIQLQVPRVRDGSYFPSLLEPRRRAEQALVAVVQEAYIQGVSTRRVDELVQALGMQGISKSQVSRLCAKLDAVVERFRSRRLEGPYPYVWLDATYLKVRAGGRVVSMAIVLAIGVRASGEREVLGLDVGPSEDGSFWLAFLRGLVARGLGGVQLVISDAHPNPIQGTHKRDRGGPAGRRLATLPRALHAQRPGPRAKGRRADGRRHHRCLVASNFFAQPDPASAREQWRRIVDSFRPRHERLAALLDAAESDVLAYLTVPREHWHQIWSNNPLERLNGD